MDGFTVTLGDLTLSDVDAFGVDWRTFAPLTGWGGSPGSTIDLAQKPRSPGAWVGNRQLTPRVLALTGIADCPDPDSMRAAQDRLTSAATLDAARLTVVEGSLGRWCQVYRQDEVLAEAVTDTLLNWSLQLVAADPRKFADDLTATTALPATTGGLTIPFTIPFAIAASVVTGQVTLTNPGNVTGPVKLRIDGPCTGPIVTHVSTGLQLVFSSSLVIDAGDWLEVDMEAQTVLANGQSSRNGAVTQRGWFGFDPGPNTFAFAAVGYDSGAQLTVTATPAWQ